MERANLGILSSQICGLNIFQKLQYFPKVQTQLSNIISYSLTAGMDAKWIVQIMLYAIKWVNWILNI